MKLAVQRKYQVFIFTGFLIILYICLGIQNIIPLRPQSIHQWAQCDRASVALNYFRNGMNFFLPRVHNLDNGTGITGMEFPFVNYCAAILYKIFGFHEWLYRLFTLFIYSSGLYFAFKISSRWINNFWISIGIAFIFSCSPLLVFYSANFLPEPSSLGFALGAWYYLLNYIDNAKKKNLILWYLFISLSCLIKLSSLINLPAMLLLCLLKTAASERRKIIPVLILRVFIIAGITFSWYYYAAILSDKTHSEIFLLQSKFPENWFVFVDVWKQMRLDWFYRIYNDALLSVAVIAMIAGLILKKTKDDFLFIIVPVLFLSMFAFLLSMWTQLRHHDYYLIPMYTVFLFAIIATVKAIQGLPPKSSLIILSVLIPVTLAYQFYESKNHLRTSYKKDSWKYSALHFDQYFNVNEVLRRYGIRADDKVISVFDHTPEVSLYLMDQKGVTVAYRNSDFVFEQYLNSGMFDFVIFNASSEIENYHFHPEKYALEQLGETSSIKIYRVSSEIRTAKKKTQYPALLSPWN